MSFVAIGNKIRVWNSKIDGRTWTVTVRKAGVSRVFEFHRFGRAVSEICELQSEVQSVDCFTSEILVVAHETALSFWFVSNFNLSFFAVITNWYPFNSYRNHLKKFLEQVSRKESGRLSVGGFLYRVLTGRIEISPETVKRIRTRSRAEGPVLWGSRKIELLHILIWGSTRFWTLLLEVKFFIESSSNSANSWTTYLTFSKT